MLEFIDSFCLGGKEMDVYSSSPGYLGAGIAVSHLSLTLLGPQSRFGVKSLGIRMVCPQIGTAVLKGLRCFVDRTCLKRLNRAKEACLVWEGRVKNSQGNNSEKGTLVYESP